ncbi:MAG: hypothetical protein M1538_01145 [Candidatus Marsarchaeota archaeon]|jgi:peptidoglycan hydrolase CwlO-like protein|nr:hypothetical protein [Candidatus Marsarchaeota archaeon]
MLETTIDPKKFEKQDDETAHNVDARLDFGIYINRLEKELKGLTYSKEAYKNIEENLVEINKEIERFNKKSKKIDEEVAKRLDENLDLFYKYASELKKKNGDTSIIGSDIETAIDNTKKDVLWEKIRIKVEKELELESSKLSKIFDILINIDKKAFDLPLSVLDEKDEKIIEEILLTNYTNMPDTKREDKKREDTKRLVEISRRINKNIYLSFIQHPVYSKIDKESKKDPTILTSLNDNIVEYNKIKEFSNYITNEFENKIAKYTTPSTEEIQTNNVITANFPTEEIAAATIQNTTTSSNAIPQTEEIQVKEDDMQKFWNKYAYENKDISITKAALMAWTMIDDKYLKMAKDVFETNEGEFSWNKIIAMPENELKNYLDALKKAYKSEYGESRDLSNSDIIKAYMRGISKDDIKSYKLTDEERGLVKRSRRRFFGIKDDEKLKGAFLSVMYAQYLLNNNEQNVVQTPTAPSSQAEEKSSIQQNIATFQGIIEHQMGVLDKKDAKIKELNEEIEKLQKEIKELKEVIEEQRKVLSEKEEKIKNLEDESNSKDTKIEKLKGNTLSDNEQISTESIKNYDKQIEEIFFKTTLKYFNRGRSFKDFKDNAGNKLEELINSLSDTNIKDKKDEKIDMLKEVVNDKSAYEAFRNVFKNNKFSFLNLNSEEYGTFEDSYKEEYNNKLSKLSKKENKKLNKEEKENTKITYNISNVYNYFKNATLKIIYRPRKKESSKNERSEIDEDENESEVVEASENNTEESKSPLYN